MGQAIPVRATTSSTIALLAKRTLAQKPDAQQDQRHHFQPKKQTINQAPEEILFGGGQAKGDEHARQNAQPEHQSIPSLSMNRSSWAVAHWCRRLWSRTL